MDKELGEISREAVIGNRIIDKLIEVHLKNGATAYVLLHLEVQGNADPEFEKRMYTYRYRLHDLYQKPIANLAILIDGDAHWRPSTYRDARTHLKF